MLQPSKKPRGGELSYADKGRNRFISRIRVRIAGEPRNAGRIGVGRVLYGAKFNHEFSPPTEDQPTWDSGPKAA
jgi:hypothetical protein